MNRLTQGSTKSERKFSTFLVLFITGFLKEIIDLGPINKISASRRPRK